METYVCRLQETHEVTVDHFKAGNANIGLAAHFRDCKVQLGQMNSPDQVAEQGGY